MSVRIRRPSVRVRRRSVRPGEGDVLYAEEVSLVDRAVQLEEARRASHEAGAPSVDRTREGDPRRSSSGREGADPGRPGRFERLPSTGGVGNDDGLERRRREDGTSSSPIREFPVDPNAIEEAEGTLAARHNRAIADAAIERELKAQRALHWKDRMAPTGPTEERKAGRPKRRASIVAALASRHRVAQERRDEARRQRRLDRFAELHPLRDIPEGSAQAPQDTVQTRHEALTSMTAQPQRSSSRGSRIRASSPRSDAGSSAASGSSSGGAVAWFRGLADPERDLEAVNEEEQHASEVVDHLDVVDPGISTVAHLTNVGNSIMFPPIPRLYSRMPVVDLPQPSAGAEADAHQDMEAGTLKRRGTRLSLAGGADELDVHVHELLTKRQKVRRALAGLWAFLKTPVGIIVGIYGFLVVFWGAALVLFIVGWIKVGDKKDLWVEICSQVVNGLFTVTGVGLIPWRVRDTYRMIRIAHYQHLTWRLRKQRGLPALSDRNDLPDGVRESKELNGAAEDDARYDQEYVLSPRQAAKLAQLQHDFAASQSWYRPHETSTHRAFPISFALAITFFNDGNSLFQCMLCGVMWGFAGFTNEKYKQRPAWTTGCLIPFSFLCGIVAGVLIWRGGERTKKKEEVEQRLLDALEIDAEELGSASLELLPEPKAEGAEGAEGNEVEGLATPVRPRGFDAGANDQPSSALGEEISNEQVHPLQQER